jgi:uncharacterized membrane protein
MSIRFLWALTALLFLPVFAGAAALGQDPNKDPSQEIEKAEPLDDVQEIEEIQEIEAFDADTGMGIWELIGKFHPALIHFPIAWLVLLLAVEIGAVVIGGDMWYKAGRLLLAAATLSFLPSLVTGFLHASYQGSDPAFLELMLPHRNISIASAILCLAALLLARRPEPLTAAQGWIFRGLIAASTLLVLYAGHLGGKMVFGENYLPF